MSFCRLDYTSQEPPVLSIQMRYLRDGNLGSAQVGPDSGQGGTPTGLTHLCVSSLPCPIAHHLQTSSNKQEILTVY